MDDYILAKKCCGCKKKLPHSKFPKDRSRKDGLGTSCRGCRKAMYQAKREEKLAYQKAYREANREKKAVYDKAWREANPENVKAHQKAWREANPEYQKAYRAANPDKMRAHRQNRRARLANAQGSHTAEQVSARFAVHGDACIYCSSPENLHADHLKPLAQGGSNWASNIVPACSSCNIAKRDKWGEDLRSWVRENCTVPRTRRRLG